MIGLVGIEEILNIELQVRDAERVLTTSEKSFKWTVCFEQIVYEWHITSGNHTQSGVRYSLHAPEMLVL